MSITWNNFRFIDSLQFLNASLDNLVAATPRNAFMFTSTLRHHRLLMRKGVYPYEYMNDWDRFDETRLPPQEMFHSSLNDSDISDEDYQHAQRVWTTFGCENLGDYHDLYLCTDVYPLADVFKHFRKTALSTYQPDPAHYFTLPGNLMCKFLSLYIP